MEMINTFANSRKPYDSWQSEVYAMSSKLNIGDWSSLTISSLAGLISKWLLGISFGIAINIANEWYDHCYGENAYENVYYRSNSYCNILTKQRHVIHGADNSYLDEVNTIHWVGNANDPGAQYSCRDVARYW